MNKFRPSMLAARLLVSGDNTPEVCDHLAPHFRDDLEEHFSRVLLGVRRYEIYPRFTSSTISLTMEDGRLVTWFVTQVQRSLGWDRTNLKEPEFLKQVSAELRRWAMTYPKSALDFGLICHGGTVFMVRPHRNIS